MNTITTNATCSTLANTLNEGRKGTFTGIITTKKGVTRGRGAQKKVYGNDTVHAVVVTGISYTNLKLRDLTILESLNLNDLVDEAAKNGAVDKNGVALTADDFATAMSELRDSTRKSIVGTNSATHDHVFEPLVVDGEIVRGSRVYKCVASETKECKCYNCTGDYRAPKPGAVYLSGIQVSSKVLVAAENGPIPKAKSKATVVAKNIIRRKLPSRRYVNYVLEVGGDYVLRVGGTAGIEADKDGVRVSADAVAEVNAAFA